MSTESKESTESTGTLNFLPRPLPPQKSSEGLHALKKRGNNKDTSFNWHVRMGEKIPIKNGVITFIFKGVEKDVVIGVALLQQVAQCPQTGFDEQHPTHLMKNAD